MNYTIIKTAKQYKEYSARVMKLASEKPLKNVQDEIELLEMLIDKWEKEHFQSKNMDPIQLLKYLMDNRNMAREELIGLLGISKSAVSQILNYKKGLSKDVIRKLSEFFKVSQEAFNRNYSLISDANRGHKNEKMMNIKKEFERA